MLTVQLTVVWERPFSIDTLKLTGAVTCKFSFVWTVKVHT